MRTHTRRLALFGASVVAFLGLGLYVSFGITPPDFFAGKADRKPISFNEANSRLKDILAKEIPLSQRDFDVKYTQDDIDRIYRRMWDQAQLILSEFYVPLESRTERENPRATGSHQ